MSISPLSPTFGLNQSIAEARQQLADLQEQLASGKKVKTYGDLGVQRSQILSMRSELSRISGYKETISQVDIRLDVMLQSLERVRELASESKSDALESGFDVTGSGKTVYQTEMAARFEEVTSLLNSKIGDRHLFSGRETEKPPVLPATQIMEGTGSKAGFEQIVGERRQADLGADGRGRLVLAAPAGDTATIAEDAAGSPFGFKIAAVSSGLTGTNVTGPSGSPSSVDVEFTGSPPKDGETIRLTLDLPDGTQHELTMTARESGPLKPGEFLIGSDAATTASNFQNALTTEVETEAQRSLSAASLYAAADNFFDYDESTPPQRVDGPPFDTATSLRDATAGDTVSWYQGEVSSTDARQSVLAKADDSVAAPHGARANEDALRSVIKNFAAMSVETFDADDPNAADRYHEMKLRANDALSFKGNAQAVDDIISELTVSKTSLGQAGERHQASESVLQGVIGEAENADTYEVGTKVYALQARLEASLQVSVSLSRLSLTNFL